MFFLHILSFLKGSTSLLNFAWKTTSKYFVKLKRETHEPHKNCTELWNYFWGVFKNSIGHDYEKLVCCSSSLGEGKDQNGNNDSLNRNKDNEIMMTYISNANLNSET